MDAGAPLAGRLLRAALNGLAARQRVIGDNLANVDTPGFAASRVQFEDVLQRALGQGESLPLHPVPNGLEPDEVSFRPAVVTLSDGVRRADGNNVDVDQEMVALAETNLTYNALAQLVGNRLGLLRTVINDGRR